MEILQHLNPHFRDYDRVSIIILFRADHLDIASSSTLSSSKQENLFQSSGSLTVFASEQNNQTSVTCKQLHIPNSIFSQTGILDW